MSKEVFAARATILLRSMTIKLTPSSIFYRYGFKAMQRFQVAHGDLVAAISKKEEDLQNALRSTDPTILQDMEEQAVNSSGGVGVYRQKRGVGRESGLRGRSSTVVRPMKSPEKLRDSFAQSLEVLRNGRVCVAAAPKPAIKNQL